MVSETPLFSTFGFLNDTVCNFVYLFPILLITCSQSFCDTHFILLACIYKCVEVFWFHLNCWEIEGDVAIFRERSFINFILSQMPETPCPASKWRSVQVTALGFMTELSEPSYCLSGCNFCTLTGSHIRSWGWATQPIIQCKFPRSLKNGTTCPALR